MRRQAVSAARAIGVWAPLYILLTIDPAVRDKIAAARDLAGLMQTTSASAGRDASQ
jgi:hypothetical protein